NIRRFGAGWLRPPGIPKTLQGMADEKAEREEQELVAQREQAMMDAQAAAEEEAMEQNGGALRAIEGGEEGEMVDEDDMRDLDDEVPDAGMVGEAEGWESSDDEEDGDNVDEGNQEIEGLGEGEEISIAVDADVLVGQSFTGAGEEGEGDYGVPGMLEGEGRDLDEDVPEAGSYQHTDTEVEDESSVEEGGSFVVGGREGVLGRSVWGGSPGGVMAGGGYDGPAGGGLEKAVVGEGRQEIKMLDIDNIIVATRSEHCYGVWGDWLGGNLAGGCSRKDTQEFTSRLSVAMIEMG
ncbi:MAG: hypothetical protein Q9213_005831, partial [Squamulea squamosa]